VALLCTKALDVHRLSTDNEPLLAKPLDMSGRRLFPFAGECYAGRLCAYDQFAYLSECTQFSPEVVVDHSVTRSLSRHAHERSIGQRCHRYVLLSSVVVADRSQWRYCSLYGCESGTKQERPLQSRTRRVNDSEFKLVAKVRTMRQTGTS